MAIKVGRICCQDHTTRTAYCILVNIVTSTSVNEFRFCHALDVKTRSTAGLDRHIGGVGAPYLWLQLPWKGGAPLAHAGRRPFLEGISCSLQCLGAVHNRGGMETAGIYKVGPWQLQVVLLHPL